MMNIKIHDKTIGDSAPLAFIAGPCVIESEEMALEIAGKLARIADARDILLVFKASFDKANRSSVENFRGPGMEKGLAILSKVKEATGLPVLTDIHLPGQAAPAAECVDILQIPAFLCRQTDILVAAGKTNAVVNIKKGQFMAPADMKNAVEKVRSTGCENILLTERGTTFGYNNLVVDMRGLAIMREYNIPVVFDATHSVQLPGGQGSSSGGERHFVPLLSRAAVAAGVDAVFMEVHPEPECALCDGANSWPLDKTESLIDDLLKIDAVRREITGENT